MIGSSVVLASFLYMVMTLGFMLMHGSMESEFLYVDKVFKHKYGQRGCPRPN